MNLRSTKKAINNGEMVLDTAGKPAPDKRTTEAATLARIYLTTPKKVGHLAFTLDVTPERAAQIVRQGISYLRESGQLHSAPAE